MRQVRRRSARLAAATAAALLGLCSPAIACEVMIPKRPPLLDFKPGRTTPRQDAALARRVNQLTPAAAAEFGNTIGAVIVEWNVEADARQQALDERRAAYIRYLFMVKGVPPENVLLRPLDRDSNLAAFSRSRETRDSFQVRSAECGDGTFI